MNTDIVEKNNEEANAQTGVNQWEIIKHYLAPIADLIDMEGVTEIFVDRYDAIFIKCHGELKLTDVKFQSEAEVQRLIRQVGNALGQPVHEDRSPILDARLPTGARFHAMLSPYSTLGSSINIRCFPKTRLTPMDLVKSGSLTQEMLDYLQIAVACYSNMLISGATDSGKTTLLNVLSNFIGKHDRVITVEDTKELQIEAYSLLSREVPFRIRKEGDQEINLSRMIGATLRETPDRILVGELRYPDAAQAFLTVLNTGHRGCATTIHANSCTDALFRLDALVASNGVSLPFEFIQQQVRRNIDIVVYQEKTPLHGRKIVEIVEVSDKTITPIFTWDYTKGRHESFVQHSSLREKTSKFGIDASQLWK